MSKTIRTTLSLGISLVLFSALMMAQAVENNVGQDKNKEHHSRFAKAAFWRHHKDGDKNVKPVQATQAQSKPAQVKKAQMKPVSAKQATGKNDQKQEPRASNMGKPSAKKAPPANNTKPGQKVKDSKTVSVKK